MIMAAWAVVLFTSLAARAQSQAPAPQRLALRVAGLTAADRDAVQQALQGRTDVRLSFACVPAGILLFEHSGSEDGGSLRDRALPMVAARVARHRIDETTMTQAEAEAACAATRQSR
jgi:hypothetical protein